MSNQSESTSSNAGTGGLATDVGALSSSRIHCGPLLGTVAALLGSVAAWGVWQALDPVFTMPEELVDLPTPVPPDKAAEQDLATATINRHHATLAMAILGALVGGFLATAEAYSRRALQAACWKGPATAALAALLGAGAGLAGSMVLESPDLLGGWSPLAKTIVVQAVTLGTLGLGIGIATAIPQRTLRLILNSALGGILGGMLAALIYPACVAYLLPVAQTERVMPKETTSRLIWMTMAAGLIGMTLTGVGKRKKKTGNPKR